MKTTKLLLAIFILLSNILVAQSSEEIWGIGTKWTYEFQLNPNEYGYLTNEIIDTVMIDELKLYQIETFPNEAYSGIQYLHYNDNKVYNYNTNFKILQLLYDFNNEEGYWLDYRPICDLLFDYDSLISRQYYATINDINDYQMPDGTLRKIQNATVTDTVTEVDGSQILVTMNRQILQNIGFTNGYLHHSHDWELGTYICSESGNFITDLRCFENDSVSYNFKNYPCDSTWILSSTTEIEKDSQLTLFPNPTNHIIQIRNFNKPQEYKIYDIRGKKTGQGLSNDGTIELKQNGVNIILIKSEDEVWKSHTVMKIGNSR